MNTQDSDPSTGVKSGLVVSSRLRRSCEACRTSKGRCLPHKDDPTRCAKYVT